MRNYFLIICMFLLAIGVEAKKEKTEVSLLVSKGDSCMKEHDSFHAIDFYHQHLAEHPKDLDVLRKIASCYRQRGDNKSCINYMDSIPKDSLTHEDLRMLFYANLNLDSYKAGVWGSDILRNYPYDGEVVASLFSYWNNHSHEDYTNYYAKEYREKTDSTNLLANKEYAYSMFLIGAYDKAIPLYEKVIADGLDNFETNFVLGMSYYKADKFEEAFTILTKAAEIKGKINASANNLYFLGLSCQKLSEKAENKNDKIKYRELAISNLSNSLTAALPNDRSLYVFQQLGELYYNSRLYEQAGDAFAKSIGYDKEDSPLNYYNTAQMYIGAQAKTQARFYLQMFLEKAPKLEDEKERATLTAKAKEQLKDLNKK